MVLSHLEPANVFHFFEDICAIPHGSGNTDAIASYCMAFAKDRGLKAVRDEANNVVIFKEATPGYEHAETVILQGHLDMVCQKEAGSTFDFETDSLELFVDGDFVKAKGTTLGADNGIAVAMVLSLLDSSSVAHPPIEAVFTIDEETGMIGAGKLDMSILKGKRMINLDAESDDTLTVSCAGGSDFQMAIHGSVEPREGTEVTLTLHGLRGGHSGVEIHTGRVNADMLCGRFLNRMLRDYPLSLLSINGGDKANAIPNRCVVRLCVKDAIAFCRDAKEYLKLLKDELATREPQFAYILTVGQTGTFDGFDEASTTAVVRALVCAPNGVMEMSADIDGLVETSLNLGILQTEDDAVTMHFALRSNKESGLVFMEERMIAFAEAFDCVPVTFGHYPPWEFKADSKLQAMYKECYRSQHGVDPKVEAIHAGLECGLFASRIEDIDCIAIGPTMYDVHTVHERLSISSTERTYRLLKNMLKNCR